MTKNTNHVLSVPLVQKHRKKRRLVLPRIRLRYWAAIAVALWGAYTYVFVQRPLLINQQAQRVVVERQLQIAIRQAKYLKQQIRNLHTYGYIATLAEKKYNMLLPGEILFTVEPPQKTVKKS